MINEDISCEVFENTLNLTDIQSALFCYLISQLHLFAILDLLTSDTLLASV